MALRVCWQREQLGVVNHLPVPSAEDELALREPPECEDSLASRPCASNLDIADHCAILPDPVCLRERRSAVPARPMKRRRVRSGSQHHGVFDSGTLDHAISHPIGEALRPSLARGMKADLLVEVSRSLCIARRPQEHFDGVLT